MMTSISEQLQKLRMRLNQENENSVTANVNASNSSYRYRSNTNTNTNTNSNSNQLHHSSQQQQQQQPQSCQPQASVSVQPPSIPVHQNQTPLQSQPQPQPPQQFYHSNRHLPNNSNYQPFPQRQYSLSATQRQPNNSNLQLNLALVSNRNNSNREIGSQLQLQSQSQSQLQSQSTSLINAQCLSPRPRPKQLMIGNDCQSRPGSPSRAVKPNNLLFPSNGNNFYPNSRNNNNTVDDYKLNEFQQNNSVLTIDGKKYSAQDLDLQYLDELGSGSCGHVVKMRHMPSGKVVAVKQMRRSGNKEENKRIIMDLDILLACHDCPNIVQCYGYFIKDTEVWICMELMTTCFDKLLKKLKTSIPENILGKISVATVKALNYLKDNHGVIHRDVKPSNILINEKGVVKLCDFGISGRLVDSKAKTRSAGCAAYMAPERIDPPDTSNPSYDIRADVWSLGITLVELATGKFPYHDCKTDFELLSKVIQDDPPSLPPNGLFSMDFCSFVKSCLTKDYRKRPKYKKLLDHAFIKRYEKANVNVEQWFRNVMQTENFAESPDLSPYTNN